MNLSNGVYSASTASPSTKKCMDTPVAVISGLMVPALNNGRVPERHHWARLPSLLDALSNLWTEDAMILGYRVTTKEGVLASKFPRLTKGSWCRDRVEKLGLRVETTMILVDVDLVLTEDSKKAGKTKQPWTKDTLAEFHSWWTAGHAILAQAGVYLTLHGFRLIYVMDAPVDTYTLAESIGAQVWLDLKDSGLEHSGKFSVDPSCKDWTRLMRAPRARKENGERLAPAYEDYSRVSAWTPPVVSPEAMDTLTSSGSQVRDVTVLGDTFSAPPSEWLPAASYLGEAIRVAGGRQNRIGWHGTYLAVAGSLLHLGAPPEAVEALVAYIVDCDPVWCNLRSKRCASARSSIQRWCAGDTVMGLGKLSQALGSSVASTFRSLSPIPSDESLPGVEMMTGCKEVEAQTVHKWTALDFFSFNDPTRALEVIEALRKGEEDYATLMVTRQEEARKVEGSNLHYGCQLAGRETIGWTSKFRSIQDNLDLTRWNCTDPDLGPTTERAVRNAKTRKTTSAPNHCRKTNCTHCGSDVLAAHFCGVLLGPVRRRDEEWDITPMADRTLYVYNVAVGDFRKFKGQFDRQRMTGFNLPRVPSPTKQIKTDHTTPHPTLPAPTSEGWVGFDPEDGTSITVLSSLDITPSSRAKRGSYVPVKVGTLTGRAEVLEGAYKLAVGTFSKVALPMNESEKAAAAQIATYLDIDIIGPIPTVPVRYGVGGSIRSSDSLISDPQTIITKSRAHAWTLAAKRTTMEQMAVAAYQLNIPVTVESDPDTLKVTKVVVDMSALTIREGLVYDSTIELCQYTAKKKQEKLDTLGVAHNYWVRNYNEDEMLALIYAA